MYLILMNWCLCININVFILNSCHHLSNQCKFNIKLNISKPWYLRNITSTNRYTNNTEWLLENPEIQKSRHSSSLLVETKETKSWQMFWVFCVSSTQIREKSLRGMIKLSLENSPGLRMLRQTTQFGGKFETNYFSLFHVFNFHHHWSCYCFAKMRKCFVCLFWKQGNILK